MIFRERQRVEAERKAERLMLAYKSQASLSKTQVAEEFAWPEDD